MPAFRPRVASLLAVLFVLPAAAQHGVSPSFDLYWEWEGGPRWLTGVNAGRGAFFGGLEVGAHYLGSTVRPDEYVDVEIRFNSTERSSGVIYSTNFFQDGRNIHVGDGTFAGSAWDVSDPAQPRRLNVLMTQFSPNAENGRWDPDEPGQPSRFEDLVIMRSSYGDARSRYGPPPMTHGLSADVLYVVRLSLVEGTTAYPADTGVLRIRRTPLRTLRAWPGEGQVKLSWRHDRPEVAGLRLYGGTTFPAATLVAELPATQRSFTHTGLVDHTPYFYRLEAVSADGAPLYRSDEATATPRKLSHNLSLVAGWHGRTDYGDVWGYTDPQTGREYALLCSRPQGLSIIDVTDGDPVEVAFVPSPSPAADAKDVKVLGHYAILVNEMAAAQVIDLQDPAHPVVVSRLHNGPEEGHGGSHTVHVSGSYAYLMGGSGRGLSVFDLTDPRQPRYLSSLDPYYYHDLHVRGDTGYALAIFGQGVDVLDLSDKRRPRRIANFNYPGSGAHNAWLSEDGRYLFVGDEIGQAGNHTRVFDVQDVDAVEQVADIIVHPAATAHNSVVKGRYLYIAHYAEGVRVFDVADPRAPVEVAYYDTHPERTDGWNGVWTVYPFFASGKIIASDQVNGLYVLRLGSGGTAAEPSVPATASPGLAPNYPNPFRSATTIPFALDRPAHARLRVFDVLGREVARPVDAVLPAGRHEAAFESAGRASGTYFYRLEVDGRPAATRAMVSY